MPLRENEEHEVSPRDASDIAEPNQFCASRIRAEEETLPPGDISGEDVAGGAVVQAGRRDRAALPEERQARAAADRAGADAAHVLRAAVVRLGRRGGGRCHLRLAGAAQFHGDR